MYFLAFWRSGALHCYTCKALNLEYATSWLREIFKHEARSTTAEISSLKTYVVEITTYLRCTKPHSTSLAVSAAELRILS
jgi:hypothetical protein